MKKKLFSLVFIIYGFQCESEVINISTVQEQLEKVNKNWIGKDFNDSILKCRISLSNDVSLIQMHLSLVEQKLRNTKNCNLNTEQKLNREKCLNILHSYWEKGVFPKNTDFVDRTPYFIDKFGTACAVGQLIISTGFESVADKIRTFDNNGYVAELNCKYQEISEWADLFGFTINELEWIQPCYCSTGGPGTLNVTCYGASNGYFVANPSGGFPPYTYNGWYRWNGTSWDLLPCGGCDLIAGDYKCNVVDAVGTSQDYFATITEPFPISTVETIVQASCFSCCNGSASISSSGGTAGYTYTWTPGGQTTPTINSLCPGTYNYCVADSNGCVYCDSVLVSFSTAISQFNKSNSILISPNPATSYISLEFQIQQSEEVNIKIKNVLGVTVYSERTNGLIGKQSKDVDISILKTGVYFVELSHEDGFITKKIIKE